MNMMQGRNKKEKISKNPHTTRLKWRDANAKLGYFRSSHNIILLSKKSKVSHKYEHNASTIKMISRNKLGSVKGSAKH